MSIFAGSEGFLDDIPVRDVPKFEKAFLAYMRDVKSSVREALEREKKMSDKIAADLKAALTEFKATYFKSSAPAAAPAMATA
jgi:F-type H+-transporting ATPase subunit alpha